MSSFLKLNFQDLLKGVIVTVLTSVLTSVYTIIQSGVMPTLAELKTIALTGLMAGIAYLCKNILTNSNGQVLKSE